MAAQSVLGQHFTEDIGYNLFSGKLTFNIAQGSTLVGTYFRDPEHRDGAIFTPTSSDADSFAGRRDIGSEDYAGRYNQLFGSFGVLTLQYAKHKDRYIFKPLDNTQVGVVDRTNAADYPFYPTFNGFGSIPGFTQHNTGDRDAYEGSFTSYFSNHELKVGGDWVENVTTAVTSFTGGQRIRVRTCSTSPSSASYCPPGQGVQYTNYLGDPYRVYFEHNFYSDQLGSFNPIAATTTAPPSELWSGYVQDTWRIKPRLTLNAGVRYDVQEIQNAQEVTTIDLDDQWSPRAGLIFDWKGDGSTKLFASYGRFYYAIPNDLNVRVYGSQFSTTTWNCLGPTSPNGAMPPGGTPATQDNACVPNRNPLFQGGAAFQPVDENLDGMYQDEFTLGVEMALTPTFAVGLKGMYRELGNVIEDRCDLDYNNEEINHGASCALINPGSGERWSAAGAPTTRSPGATIRFRVRLSDLRGCATRITRRWGSLPRSRMPSASSRASSSPRARPSPRTSGRSSPTSGRSCGVTTTVRFAWRRVRPTRASTRTTTTRSSPSTPTDACTSTGRTSCVWTPCTRLLSASRWVWGPTTAAALPFPATAGTTSSTRTSSTS